VFESPRARWRTLVGAGGPGSPRQRIRAGRGDEPLLATRGSQVGRPFGVDLLRACIDSDGHGSLPFQDIWTAADAHGHRLEIYGSEGWVFESPRARCESPCAAWASVVSGSRPTTLGLRARGVLSGPINPRRASPKAIAPSPGSPVQD
jgi:hypothetical protein